MSINSSVALEFLNAWLGPLEQRDCANQVLEQLWFEATPKQDEDIRQRWYTLLQQAAAGDCDHWVQNPRTRLALIIIFDQLPRMIYRGEAKAYSFDQRAQAHCLQGCDLGHDSNLKLTERMFFYLPLEHSEDTAIQAISVNCFSNLVDAFPEQSAPAQLTMARQYLAYAEKHAGIIERFGRFPYRNHSLRRVDTPAEVEWLSRPDSERFGQ